MRTMNLLALLVIVAPPVASASEPLITDRARTAIDKSLPYLRSNGRSWMDGKVKMQDKKGCVSCHYVNFGVWSHRAVEGLNFDFPQTEVKALAQDATKFIDNREVGRPVSWSHAILSNNSPSDQDRKRYRKWAGWFPDQQHKSGFWAAKGQFPSQSRKVVESNSVATMWAVTALVGFAQEDKIAASIERAYKWLDESPKGETSEWLAWRLIVDHRRSKKESVELLKQQLLARQNGDGGWSWAPGEPSDAYATGQVLYAFIRTSSEADVEKAVEYLLQSQGANGRWTVESEFISNEPDKNKDHIYSYWGTAWSTIALGHFLRDQESSTTGL